MISWEASVSKNCFFPMEQKKGIPLTSHQKSTTIAGPPQNEGSKISPSERINKNIEEVRWWRVQSWLPTLRFVPHPFYKYRGQKNEAKISLQACKGKALLEFQVRNGETLLERLKEQSIHGLNFLPPPPPRKAPARSPVLSTRSAVETSLKSFHLRVAEGVEVSERSAHLWQHV